MKIIISPAKKMNTKPDSVEGLTTPFFLEKAKVLAGHLQSLSYSELKVLLNCNDKIAQLNYDRYQHMDLSQAQTPGLLSYEGIQYQYMAPEVFTTKEWEYIHSKLCILSGLYGVLRPLDKIMPYRLEMQAKLKSDLYGSIYEYWQDEIYNEIITDTDTIINLASKEYSKVIDVYIEPHIRYITCVFGELINGKVIVKGTQAKMARGEMVRFMAGEGVQDVDGLKEFQGLGYSFTEQWSDEKNFVFLKNRPVK